MILNARTPLAGGRYIVQRHLDSGAMADVYLATDTLRAVNVALKVLRSEYSLDEYFEDYFRREAAVLQQLQHPNIVRLYELERDSNLLFLVMDFIEGLTLQQHLFEQKLLQTAYVLQIGQAIATALDYAHTKGVIHRDVKPSNVLLASSGVILLNDFGVARVAGNTTSAGASGPVGTLAYMAPEQIRGAEITGAADQYALAVVIWELLCGRRPFTGKASKLTASPLSERIIDEHLHHTPPANLLPPGLTAALAQALAKDPRQRFPTCAAFMQVLQTAAARPVSQDFSASESKTPNQPQPPAKLPQSTVLTVTQIVSGLLVLYLLVAILVAVAPALFADGILSITWGIGFIVFLSAPYLFFTHKNNRGFLFVLLVVASFSMGKINTHREKIQDLAVAAANTAAVPTSASLPIATATATSVMPSTATNTPPQTPTISATGNATGTKIYLSGRKYIGELRNDMANGQGTITFNDGATYTGEWKNDRFNGQGTLTFNDGETYTGEWKDDKKHGQGTETYADGATYTGEWKDDKKHGRGTYTFADGTTYAGEWKNAERNGQGTISFADGATYAGEWKNDERNGQGTISFADGATYAGEWKDDKKHGRGTYTYADGTTYAGEWKDNLPNGQGIEKDKLGSATYIGEFKDGKHVTATAIAVAPATATPPPAKPANTVAAPTAAPVVVPTAAATVSPPTAAAPVAEAPAPTATTTTAVLITSSETASQTNARKSAQKYLRVLAFSRGRLINQLKYEGFSEEDAAYAVDSLNTNWNEQALKKVASYLRASAFSRSRLIGQLVYEQYSQEQAEFAVNGTAIDWNEQAAKKAANYLKVRSFSRDELIAQLKYEDFTQEQAEYGVSNVGL